MIYQLRHIVSLLDDGCEYLLVSTKQTVQVERDFYRFVVDNYVVNQIRKRISKQGFTSSSLRLFSDKR